jgi:hypothetical protein
MTSWRVSPKLGAPIIGPSTAIASTMQRKSLTPLAAQQRFAPQSAQTRVQQWAAMLENGDAKKKA